MPVSQKIKETGWFYHAPAKKVVMEKVEAPAPSQIPGIGFDNPEDYEKEEVREMMFRETDSDYIRMAKMGGRRDLLSFNPDKYKHKPNSQARGYQRNEWFYLEDNRLEDEEHKEAEKREWEFLLPEYMVHKGYKPSFSNPGSPPTRGSNAPYHTENQELQLARDDKSAIDKTAKIQEPRKEGYGIRNQKPPPKMQALPPREKPALPGSAARRGKQNFNLAAEATGPTNMMKLMAGEYEREWHRAHEDFERTVRTTKASVDAPVPTQGGSASRTRSNPQTAITAAAQRSKAREEEERALFKLQRFKNVPSKIDSHQRPEVLAAVK